MTHPVVIPWEQGEVSYRGLPPFQGPRAGSGTLGPGRWVLTARSTIPFVSVKWGQGSRTLTWGEAVEIPSGESGGQVLSASYHPGDAHFAAVGDGWGFTAFRPASVTIPAQIFQVPASPAPVVIWRTIQVDTRLARRAYLWLAVTAGADLPWKVYLSGERSLVAGPSTITATGKAGVTDYTQTAVGYANSIPLGFGAGQNREPAPGLNSLPELRAMALLDWAFVEFTAADAAVAGISETSDAFFTLEY